MNITNFNSLSDAIHYINNRAIEDKYASDDVARKVELINKKTKQILNAYILDAEYFGIGNNGYNSFILYKENDPKLENIIDRTLRMYEESDF